MDERHHPDDEIAWFWHLGADAKLAMVMTNIAGDGGKTADPREERVKVLKPSRGEGRDVSAEPVVTAACFLFCRRAMGAASSRPSLRPLDRGGRAQQHNSGTACREKVIACLTSAIAFKPRFDTMHTAGAPKSRNRRIKPCLSSRYARKTRCPSPVIRCYIIDDSPGCLASGRLAPGRSARR